MYSHFIDQNDYGLIMQDFEMLLLSSESVVASFNINRKIGGTLDTVFNVVDSFSVSQIVVTGNAIQQIVKPVDEDILSWAVLESGDCLFYMSIDFDPGNQESDEVYIETPDGLTWIPVPIEMSAFYKFIRARLGQSQVGQCIPAKLKKSI